MSLPMSEEQFAFVIWSNEYLDWDNYRDAFEEDYSGLSDDEKYQLMCDLNSDYLDDERRNLDVQVGTLIIVIADIGRWDGRHTGYREISSGCIKDCLESQLDGVTWYVDGKGDFRMDGYHHDGRNYYLYRKYREGISEEAIEDFKGKILDHKRFAVVHGKKITKKARVEATVLNSLTPLSKAEICRILPDVSPTTVEAVLGIMVKTGSIRRVGAGRTTRYIRA